jgi:tetratricopeptide (TPR) repeat protein
MHWFSKRKHHLRLAFALFAIFLLSGASVDVLERLNAEAERAMIHRDYHAARDAYRKLLEGRASSKLDGAAYGNVIVQCARAERECGNLEGAKKMLQGFDFTCFSPSQRREPVILLARIFNDLGEIERSLGLLKQLDRKIPRGNWRREERAFYGSLTIAIDDRYDGLLSKAEEAMENCSYVDAIPSYQRVLEAAREGFYPARGCEDVPTLEAKLRYRLAEAHYQLELYTEVASYLMPIRQGTLKSTGLAPYFNEVSGHCLHLLGLAQKRQGETMQALATFTTYLDRIAGRTAERAMVEWEAALCYLQIGETEAARVLFSKITGGSQALAQLAQVYLSRIDLEGSDFSSVEERLQLLAQHLHTDDPLRYEVAYLRGEAALKRDDYRAAVARFEEALPERGRERAEWYPGTLFGLGWAYAGLAKTLEGDRATQLLVYSRAANTFDELHTFNGDERATLALARLQLAQKKLLGERQVGVDVRGLLMPVEQFVAPESQAEALLLLAEVTPAYADQEKLYARLTDAAYAETPSYPIGWLRRGINRFRQGTAYRKLGDRSPVHFEAAAEALEQAFPLLVDNALAGQALKVLAQARFHLGSAQEAYQLLSSLLTERRPLLAAMQSKDEVFYLLGLIGATTGDEAESYLEHVLEEFPDGSFSAPALNTLATLYFQRSDYTKAERLFTRLAAEHPNSNLAGNAWFWAAESAERFRRAPEVVRGYRKQVIEYYPDSEFAAQAFFEYFSFADYLQGDADALEHLGKMADLYPDSPYLVTAHYLRGLHFREAFLDEAIGAFSSAAEAFDRAYARGKIGSSSLEYFTHVRYRTLVELALSQLEKGKLSQGAERHVALKMSEEMFTSLLGDFADSGHLLARLVARDNPYPRLLEEAEFGLAQSYLAARNYDDAEATLSLMLDRYESLHRTDGYYPSRVWYHQGRLSMERGLFDTALECLRHAEEADGRQALTINQRLDLWLQQSVCFEKQGDLDQAMLLLSRIINDEAASPLRVEAMYRRSEIYAHQGRHELARKQLQATASKSGLWAAKAQEKLREIHDI